MVGIDPLMGFGMYVELSTNFNLNVPVVGVGGGTESRSFNVHI